MIYIYITFTYKYTLDTETRGSDGDRKDSHKSGLEPNELDDEELVNDKDDYFDAGMNGNQKQDEVYIQATFFNSSPKL